MTDRRGTDEPQDVLESVGTLQVITRRRVLWLGVVAALIAVVVSGAVIVRNQRSVPDAANSVSQSADEAADAQCEMFGYMRPAHVPACHRGFVTGVLVVQGETPQGWSQTTERNAVYAERLVLSQAGTPIPLLRNKLMRSEAWVEGFQSGVLYEGRDNASQEGVG